MALRMVALGRAADSRCSPCGPTSPPKGQRQVLFVSIAFARYPVSKQYIWVSGGTTKLWVVWIVVPSTAGGARFKLIGHHTIVQCRTPSYSFARRVTGLGNSL
jgi:hypothetical protein